MSITPGIAHGILWISYALYVFCFLPQVFTNHKIQSVQGLSELTIFLYLFGYLTEIPYVFFLDQPLACKVMMPMGAVVALLLAVQHVYFEPDRARKLRTALHYGGITLAVGLLSLCGFWHPHIVGNIAGWICVVLWITYQIPQVIKVFRSKSVEGFNPWMVSLVGLGAAMEIIAALTIPLPVQTLFNGIRAFCMAGIFAAQFLAYREKGKCA